MTAAISTDGASFAVAAWSEAVAARGVVVAGSLYAAPAGSRVDAARALARAGRAVHVDLIVDPSGQHRGVTPVELAEVLSGVPEARVDVHLIPTAPGTNPATTTTAAAREIDAVLAGLDPSRLDHVTVDRGTLQRQASALERFRDRGGSVWLEIPCEDPATDVPDVDGLLVMLISSGTRHDADPASLDKIAPLAARLPVGVDGGVTPTIAGAAALAGARRIVSGRALLSLRTPNPHPKGTTMSQNLPHSMRTSVLEGAKTLTIEDRPLPQAGPGDVLVRVAAVGVCGSDVHYFRHGRIGDFVVDGPLVLGHELSGVIAAVGAGVDEARIGQRVAIEPQKPCHRCRECLAGHYNLCPNMEFYATPPIDGAFTGYVTIESAFAHAVPDSISDEAAALLEPLSVAITTMRKAHVVPGSRVLIAGAGPIGIICAQTARAFGASEVIVSDLVPERRERALGYGATQVVDPAEIDVATAGFDVDAFVDASGAPRAVFAGIQAVRPAGYAVLVGLGNSEMTLPVEHIQNKEVWVTGIFRYTDTWPAGIHLVESGQVDLDSLVTGRFDLDHVEEALESDLDPASLKSIVYPHQ